MPHKKANFGLFGAGMLAVFLASTSTPDAAAVSFLVFDPDSMAMGGAGAATNTGRYRPWSNPAHRVTRPSNVSVSAYLAARGIDRQNFIDIFKYLRDVEDELELEEQLDAARNAFDSEDLDTSRLRRLSTTAERLVTEVQKLPDRPLRITAAAATHFVVENPRWAGGIYVRHYRVLGGLVENDPADLTRVQQLADTSRALADMVDGAQHLGRLVEEFNWPLLEDLIRDSANAGELNEQLRDYQQLPGVPELAQAFRNLGDTLEALDQFVDLHGLYDALRQQLGTGTTPGTIMPPSAGIPVNLPGTASPRNEDELRGFIEAMGVAIDEADLEVFLDQMDIELPLDLLPLGSVPELGDVNLQRFLRYPVPEVINTQLIFTGAEVTETALSLSRQIGALPELTVGMTLKRLSYATIAYQQRADDFDLDTHRYSSVQMEHRFWNLDIGASYQINSHWTLGLVAKNLRRKTLGNQLGGSVSIEPIVRAGVAYETDRFRLAVDYDLTRNEPLGFDPDKQYLSAGLEFLYWRQQSVRLGYRYNLVDDTRLPSAGLHFQAGPLQFDLAATYSENNREAGVALALGLMF